MPWWTLIGVETEMPWPTEDYLVAFKGKQILLRPPTEHRMPMICIESDNSDLPMNDEHLVILAREFMSELVWVEPYRLLEITRMGATVLVDLGPAPLRHCRGIGFYIDYLPQLADEKSKLALAFYREAKSVNSLPYSFLGYWKVVSLLFSDGSPNQRQWLIESLGKITNHEAKGRLAELRLQGETDDDIVRKRLYVSRRCAVAHATSQPVINPDDPRHDLEIGADLPLIKAIAEYAIEFEFGVKSRQTVHREHLYELEGFKRFFDEDVVASLMAGKTPLISQIRPFPALDIVIASKSQLNGFSNLQLQIKQVKHGKIATLCRSSNGLMQVWLILDFANERFEFNPAVATAITDDGSLDAIELGIDYFQFCYDLFSNGRIQILEHGTNNLLGKKDPFVGVNINLSATLSGWKLDIERLEQARQERSDLLKSEQTENNFQTEQK